MNKVIILLLFGLVGFTANGQQRFPSGFPTQLNTGWNRWGYAMSDSGLIIANRDTTWFPKFSGTVVFRPTNKQFYWFDSTNLRWNLFGTNIDTTSLSNRINLKLNISDTTGKWLSQSTRLVDTMYRVNDSTVGYTIKGSSYTFQILGGSGGGGGGSGTVTSVGLSLPSAFNVVPSTITTSGTFNVTGAGTTAQYIRGNGTLATTDTGMIPNFYLKVRGLLTGTSPITFNQTTGAIGINNANTTGTKGAASFTSAFSDNGSGLIDLADIVATGSCTNCAVTYNAKGQATSYSSGVGPSGSSVDTIFRTPGIDSIYYTINSVQYAIKDSLGSRNISNASLTADGNYTQNWSNKQLYVDSIGGQFLLRMGGVGSTGTRRKEFKINWGGSSFGDQIDGYNVFATIKKADLSDDSLRLGLISSGTGVLSMGYYDVATPTNNSFISYSSLNGLININAKDSIWIKGLVAAATADSILAIRQVGTGSSYKVLKIPISAAGGGATLNNIGSGFRWVAAPSGNIKTVYNSNTILWDSTSNTNGLTAKVDTSVIATQYDLTQITGGITASEGLIIVASDAQLGNTDSSSTGQITVNRFIYGTPNTKLDISRSWLESDTTRRKIIGRYNVDSLIFNGDSHTVGNAATTVTRRFSTLTCEALGFAEGNYGVGGTTMIGNTTIVIPDYNSVPPGSYLIFNFGTNDARNAAASVPGFDTTAFKIAYGNQVDAAVALNWPLDHIVIKQFEYSTEAPSFTQFINFKNATKSIAWDKGVLFDATWDYMAADAAAGFVASDGFHPNNAGHAFSAWTLINQLKGVVKNNNQVFAINGVGEFQKLYLKQSDSSSYTSTPLLLDSNRQVVAGRPNTFIRNNSSLSELDAASVSISGMGYSATAFRAPDIELVGNGSARDLAASGANIWHDGSGLHLISYNWLLGTPENIIMNQFGAIVHIGAGSINTNARLSVNGNVIASGTVQAMADFSGNSAASTQLYYSSAGHGGLQAYDSPNGVSKPLSLQEFGGNTLIGTGTDVGYKLQVEGETYLKDKVTIGRARTLNNQGLRGLSLVIDTATYIDNSTATSGTVAHVAVNSVLRPNLSTVSTGTTYTNASTWYIDNAPSSSVVTITNPWALYINSGKTRLGTVDSTATGANVLYQDPITGEIKKTGVNSGATTIYNGDGTLAGDRVVTGGSNSLTFDAIFNFRVNCNSILQSKTGGGATYSTSIVGASNFQEYGYTPTPTVYSKGAAIIIDTNNNVGFGTSAPTTMPLYASGLNAVATNLMVGGSQFESVTNINTNTTIDLTKYYIRVDASGGNVTITLPAASTAFGANLGIHYIFKRIDNSGNTVSIARAGSDTIDGATSLSLTTQYEVKEIICSSTSTWDVF